MGKQGRRKQRQKRREKDRNQNNSGTANSTTESSSSAVRQLRHPDVKVRYSALVAVQTQAQIISNHQQQQHPTTATTISWNVLHAVRELVGAETDLECAALASEVLGEYLHHQQQQQQQQTISDQSQQQSKFRETTAGWAIVLLGRLEQARKALEDIESTTLSSSSQSNTATTTSLDENQQLNDTEMDHNESLPSESSISKKKKKSKKNKNSGGSNNQNTGSGNKNKNKKNQLDTHQKQWLGFVVPTLKALTILIESNDLALEQCIHLQKQSFVTVVLGLLSLSTTSVLKSINYGSITEKSSSVATTSAAAEATPGKSTTQRLAEDCTIFAARCLHSALDDNEELAQTVIHVTSLDSSSSSSPSSTKWHDWLGSDTNETTFSTITDNALEQPKTQQRPLLPTLTRLHLLGSLVNLYQLSSSMLEDTSSQVESSCSQLILQYGLNVQHGEGGDCLLLMACKSNQNGLRFEQQLEAAYQSYLNASRLYHEQNEDAKMELEIVKQVEERKEPAREIARRQKLQQEKEAQEEEQTKNSSSSGGMVVDDSIMIDQDSTDNNNNNIDVANNSKPKRGVIQREEDGQVAKADSLQTYRDLCAPAQLSLEILANLLTCWTRHEHDMDIDDDDDFGDDGRNLGPLYQACKESVLLVDLLESMCKEQSLLFDKEASQFIEIDLNVPIHMELSELIEKISACLVNGLLSDVFDVDWQDRIWNRTVSSLSTILAATGTRRRSATDNRSDSSASLSLQGLTTLLDLLSARIETVPANSSPLKDDLMTILSADGQFSTYETKSHSISVLTKIVSQQQQQQQQDPAEVASITAVFVQVLHSFSPLPQDKEDTADGKRHVQATVLNSLMDLYGPDDFFPQIFDELKVLSAIQSCLERLSSDQSSFGTPQFDRMDPEMLETFENSERFVQYKQELNNKFSR